MQATHHQNIMGLKCFSEIFRVFWLGTTNSSLCFALPKILAFCKTMRLKCSSLHKFDTPCKEPYAANVMYTISIMASKNPPNWYQSCNTNQISMLSQDERIPVLRIRVPILSQYHPNTTLIQG